jgi:hypothetical protein
MGKKFVRVILYGCVDTETVLLQVLLPLQVLTPAPLNSPQSKLCFHAAPHRQEVAYF